MWLGPVTTAGHVEAGLYACGPCVARLHDMMWDFREAADAAPLDETGRRTRLYTRQPRTTPRRRGRHRRPRTPFGCRLYEAVTVHLYGLPAPPGHIAALATTVPMELVQLLDLPEDPRARPRSALHGILPPWGGPHLLTPGRPGRAAAAGQ